MSDFKYWAFLSYSHSDQKWGDWLHRALETYRVPRRLIGKQTREGAVPARVFPIFRDREELPVSADLSANINQALRESRSLIVICSPRAARSRWVGEEIRTYKNLGREDRILALIVDGEPNASDGKPGFQPEDECFHEALRFRWSPDGQRSETRTEPIAADARETKDGRENAKLKLLAGLLGLNFDDLKRREQERRIRRLRVVVAITLALISLFAVLSVFALSQKRRAQLALDETRKTFARSLFLQALASLDEGKTMDALAPLARSVSLDSTNLAAVSRLTMLLTYRDYALPLVLLKHGKNLSRATFSADGKRVLTSSDDGTFRVWDAQSGEPIAQSTQDSRLYSAEFSPDGKKIVTASNDKTARIWDAETGLLVMEPLPHPVSVYSARFTPDGKSILTIGADDQGRLWDANTGKLLLMLIKHDVIIQSVQFSADGKKIVTASTDRTARIWDAQTGASLTAPIQHPDTVFAAQFSPDAKRIVTACSNDTARVWDALTGTPITRPFKADKELSWVQFSPDGKKVLTASWGAAQIWDAQTGDPLGPPLKHEGLVCSARFSADGRRIVTASGDFTVRIWDARTAQPLCEPIKHESGVVEAEFSPDGTRIVTGPYDGRVRICNAQIGHALSVTMRHHGIVHSAQFSRNGQRVVTASADTYAGVWETFTGNPVAAMKHADDVLSAGFVENDKLIATTSADGTAKLWDVGSGKCVSSPVTQSCEFVKFSPNGEKVAETSSCCATIWDARTGKVLLTLSPAASRIKSVYFSADGKRIATISDAPLFDATIADQATASIWDAETGELLAGPMIHTLRTLSADIEFSADGRHILTISSELLGPYQATVWDAMTGKPVSEPISFESLNMLECAKFSPDGTRILTSAQASGREDETVQVWNVETGEALARPMINSATLGDVRFSPTGDLLVTGASDGSVRVWESATGMPASELMKHAGKVTSVQFSPDSKQIVSASEDGTVRVWDLTPRGPCPEWLPRLAEAVANQEIDRRGFLEPLKDRSVEQLREIRDRLTRESGHDEWTEWGRWFFADRAARTISPFSKLTVPEYIRGLVKENQRELLDEAERLAVGDDGLLERIEAARATLPK